MSIHPLIQAHASNVEERFVTQLDKVINKEIFLEVVLRNIHKEFDLNSGIINQDLLLDIDQAVIKGHPDSDVYLLFIYSSILYFHGMNIPEKTKILYSIGLSSLNEKNHYSVQNSMLHAKIMIKKEEGNTAEAKQLTIELLARVDKESKRFYGTFFNYAILLANSGTLNELNQNEQMILNSMINERRAWNNTYIKLTNSIMIGEYQEGFQVMENFHKKFPNTKLNSNIFKVAINELKILSGDLNENNYSDEPFKILITLLNHLLSYKMNEAAKHYKILEENKYVSFFFSNFIEFLPFHIEFGLGNIGKVRLLLKEKKDKGNWQYLDDLFLGRLHLLEKNNRKANEAFVRLSENITRYGATNRLVFELQFAKEMKLSDILHLTQGWKNIKNSNSSRIKKVSNPTPKVITKGVDLLIGNSHAIKQVKDLVKKYSPILAPILITGETGTGKELVAQAIHDEGCNPKEPFLAINCGALTESLLQSELFGYVAGAFTGAQREHQGIFEAAGIGTVFLDEFGDISPLLQVSLLRVLESNEIRLLGGIKNRKINCRIIIATNTNLQKAVGEKKFREDLFYRITRFEIKLPKLRERIEDLPLLIEHFLNYDKDEADLPKKVSKELLSALSTYRWPGNIRELKNEMEKLKILHFEKEILNLENFDFSQLQGYIPKVPELVSSSQELKETNEIPIKKNNENDLDPSSDYIIEIIQRGSKVERRLAFIKELFRKYKRLTRSQIIQIAKVNPSTATKELQMLCDERFIVRHTPTKSSSTYYFEIVG